MEKRIEIIESFPITRITDKGKTRAEDVVAVETHLTLFLNGQLLVTLSCSPCDLEDLAVGFLFSAGLLKEKKDIKNLELDKERFTVRLETRKSVSPSQLFGISGISEIRNPRPIESRIIVEPENIFACTEEFQKRSNTYVSTGGVHAAAIYGSGNMLAFKEDIGRQNTVDKLFGECIQHDISLENKMVLTSCRISSEILFKLFKGKIPVVVSSSAPTNLTVKLASQFGITLIGFVRDKRMNVYANEWRLKV